MTRPMELRTYDIIDNGMGGLYAWQPDPAQDPDMSLFPTNVLYTLHRKRLTDHELAAAYWHQHFRFQLCAEGYLTDGDGSRFAPVDHNGCPTEGQLDTEGRQARILHTLHRFAIRPHAIDHYAQENP